MFELHPQLIEDTVILGEYPLSLVLLHKDSNYPWLLLVPKRSAVTEIHHLSSEDQLQLIRESCRLAEVMTDLYAPTSMNVAALGNVVRQLHVHHVARQEDDPAWPKPIWGVEPLKRYTPEQLEPLVERLRNALSAEDFKEIDSTEGISGLTPGAGEAI